jgi:hypothetical protein
MRRMRKIGLFLLIGTAVLGACAPFSASDLVGHWRGATLTQMGDTLAIDPSVLNFHFDKNKGYTFQSTLNRMEKGTYYVYNKYLFTTDTLKGASTEKAVEILLLSKDSLHLRMNEGGNERILKLHKR